MEKYFCKRGYSGQIMVIVLVLMSILSIIALSVTLTSVRDKEEKTQNNQYQSYYAVGENKMLDFQQLIGRDPLNTITKVGTSIDLTGDTGTTGDVIKGNCPDLTSISDPTNPDNIIKKRTCTFNEIVPSNYNIDKGENLKSIISVEDSSQITNYPAQKDKDLLLDIELVALPIQIELSWAGSDTAWNFSVDKFDGTDYVSDKAIYSPNSIIFSTPVTSYNPTPATCFNYSSAINNGRTTITVNITCANKMFFRLRPIMKVGTSVYIDLKMINNTIPLQRTLTSTTTTADAGYGGSGNADNPTVVLETTYLLIAQPLSLFDYVLRTEVDVIKK
jgi:type II secretory pathway pseudopilin PulG